MEALLKELAVALNYTQEILVASLIMGRVMPMVLLTPFFGGKIAPPEIKMGIGVLFSILLWPVARGAIQGPLPMSPIPFLLLMSKEVFVGFCIGFVNSHIFTIMDVTGRLMDTARGSSMAEVMEPNSGQRETLFGNMYTQMLLVIFVLFGGHQIFLEAFFFSFSTIPINAGMPDSHNMSELTNLVIRQTGNIVLAGVLLAAPVVAATLITDVVFGILNRVAPQLNAYFMAMPVKATGGVILSIAIMDAFVNRMESMVVYGLQATEDTLRWLVPPH